MLFFATGCVLGVEQPAQPLGLKVPGQLKRLRAVKALLKKRHEMVRDESRGRCQRRVHLVDQGHAIHGGQVDHAPGLSDPVRMPDWLKTLGEGVGAFFLVTGAFLVTSVVWLALALVFDFFPHV